MNPAAPAYTEPAVVCVNCGAPLAPDKRLDPFCCLDCRTAFEGRETADRAARVCRHCAGRLFWAPVRPAVFRELPRPRPRRRGA